MSVATTTTNYGLPIFAGTDHGNWFDFNAGFQAIDTAIKAAAQAAESAQTSAAAATQLANSASSLANSVNTNLTQLSYNVQNWIGSFPTNANATYFQNPVNSAVFVNKALNLINLRITCNLVSGTTFPANTKLVNLGQNLGLTNARNVAYLMFCYQDTSNNRHSQALSYIINTDNTIELSNGASQLTNFDNTKPGIIYINQVLCTDGWFE